MDKEQMEQPTDGADSADRGQSDERWSSGSDFRIESLLGRREEGADPPSVHGTEGKAHFLTPP